MKKENKIQLNIGDELYTYQPSKGIFVYKVISERNYEDVTLYEVECQNCKNHKPCRVLISQEDNRQRFQYVTMVLENDDDEQYYWHNSSYYFLSKKECKNYAYNNIIDNYKKEIERLKESIKQKEQKISELQMLME